MLSKRDYELSRIATLIGIVFVLWLLCNLFDNHEKHLRGL